MIGTATTTRAGVEPAPLKPTERLPGLSVSKRVADAAAHVLTTFKASRTTFMNRIGTIPFYLENIFQFWKF